ncbi:hypothetical protein [Pedococcus bigeumensis]|uniref:hypothetical protein n=1 Tax=Pedococcus bigeumensis TaxID=433644 RepID=UPI002FE858F4
MEPELWGMNLAQSWAEAFAAIGTVAAFLIGVLVFARQQADRRDDEASQARQVLPGRSCYSQDLAYSGGTGTDHVLTLSAVNYSEQHIYQALIRRVAGRPGAWDDPVFGYITAHAAESLEPGRSQQLYEVHSDEPFNEYDWAIEFEFVDARGRRWLRRGLDQPRRLRQPSRIRKRLRRAGADG